MSSLVPPSPPPGNPARSERFCAAVLASDPAALAALDALRMLPSATALALLRYLADDLT